ncbi:hypothetical protein ACM66B_006950 [Microbotryomycetes sp. NB124-2]
MSLNGSAVMTDLLEMHPHFSVFRKTVNSQSQPTTGHIALDRHPSTPDSSNVFEHNDNRRSPEPATTATANLSQESWHLSEPDTSLRFGDSDSSDIRQTTPLVQSPSAAAASTSSVRLVNAQDLESPPHQRTRQSSGRASVSGKTSRHALIQFSPLSVAPSPLLSTSLPPPPVYASLESAVIAIKSTPEAAPSSAIKTILKAPRTPGTGRSVRFSASTNANVSPSDAESSPVSISQSRQPLHPLDASFDYSADLVGVEQSFGDDEPSSIVEGASHTGATFLSKLQAAIPSPDSSLVQVVDVPISVDQNADGPGRLANFSTEAHEHDSDALTVATAAGGPGHASAFLFDESNPFAGQQSVSLTQSTATTVEPSFSLDQGLTQIEEVDESSVVNRSTTSAWSSSPVSVSGTPRHGISRDRADASPTIRLPFVELQVTEADSCNGKVFGEHTNADNATSFSQAPPIVDVSANKSDFIATYDECSAAAQGNKTFPVDDSPKRPVPKRNSTSSFYRLFLERRAKDTANAAEEIDPVVLVEPELEPELEQLASNSATEALGGEDEPQDEFQDDAQDEPVFEQEQDSFVDHGRATDMSVYGTPKGEKTLCVDDATMYFSPEQNQDLSKIDNGPDIDGVEQQFDQGDSFDAESLLQVEDALNTQGPDGDLLPTFLSPIAEMSEPNTTVSSMSAFADSPFTAGLGAALSERSLLTGNNDGKSLALFCASPDSRIPRLTHPIRAPPTPLMNPFAQMAPHEPVILRNVDSNDMQLIQSLLSAQGDLISNSSTQKFLLSSLVANLREETERSAKMVDNLKRQNQDLERALEDARASADRYEDATSSARDVVKEQDKRQALQDVVDRLTTELETRIKLDKQRRKDQSRELESLRETLTRLKSDVRDSDIRLRHAQVGQADADEQRNHLKAVSEGLAAQVEALKKERDEARAHMRDEVIERDRTISMLRIELAGQQQSTLSPASRATDQRQLGEAQRQMVETVDRLRQQLVESDSILAELRDENQSLQSDLADLRESALHDQRQLEDEIVDTRSELARARQSLLDSDHVLSRTQDELDETKDRLETAELELERLNDESKLRASKIQMQESAWNEHQSEMANLLESISKLEDETAVKDKQLRQARQELQDVRDEMDNLLEARDVRLNEVETALSARIAKNEALVAECNRLAAKASQDEALSAETKQLKETVAALRKQSADREVKYQRLKKIKAEQDDDILGLNIALEAKQQEASTWKRQLQAVRQSGGPVATPLATMTTGLATATRSSRRILSSNQTVSNPVLTSSTGMTFAQETPLPARVVRTRQHGVAEATKPTLARQSSNAHVKPAQATSSSELEPFLRSTRRTSESNSKENRAPTSVRARVAVPA